MSAVLWLRESGLVVEDQGAADSVADSVLNVTAGDRRARFAVWRKLRAPYPHEVERLGRTRRELAGRGYPLLVVPFVSESLGGILTAAGWSWADEQGNFDLRAPGLVFRQRRVAAAPARKPRSLPRGSGSFAIIRALVRFSESEEPGTSALAGQVGVSQPRASQVLQRLLELDLVESSGRGRWKPHREALLDRFLAEYPGPGGSAQYCYSLDPLLEVAVRAGILAAPDRSVVVSADVGPDVIVAWRRPSVLILYTRRVLDPASLGLTSAHGSEDANVIVRLPDDLSVFPSPAVVGRAGDSELQLADPLQLVWDLQDLGGEDRVEAAGRLREWLLTRP